MNMSEVWEKNIKENTESINSKSYRLYCRAWVIAYTLECLEDCIKTEEEWEKFDKIEDDTFLQICLIERIINPPKAVINEIKDVAQREASSCSSCAEKLLRRIKGRAIA